MDASSLYSALGLTAANAGGFDPNLSWRICTIFIAALGTAALFAFFTYFQKGSKRKIVDDIKNFFLFKANFAEDLARIVFYFLSIEAVLNSLKTLTTGGDPWGFFEGLFSLVFIRFVYETATTIIRFCITNTKKEA